jgi:hypothetical protein
MQSQSVEEIAGSLIKSLIFDLVLKQVISRAIANLPFLAWPIVNPIFVYLIQKLGTMIYLELERAVAFEIINHRTEIERAAYEQSVERLKSELQNPIQDPDRVEAAKQVMRDRLRDLVRFKPS